jgi:hypothetical protein
MIAASRQTAIKIVGGIMNEYDRFNMSLNATA